MQELWNTIKKTKPTNHKYRRRRRNPKPQNIFKKIIEENIPKSKVSNAYQDTRAYRTLNRKIRKGTPHITLKTLNVQNKGLWKLKDQATYKYRVIRRTFNFSVETLKTRRVWTDILQVLKYHKCQPDLATTPRKAIYHKPKRKKNFHHKNRWKKFTTAKLAL